jgi:phosphoribosylanthranilate isomerase
LDIFALMTLQPGLSGHQARPRIKICCISSIAEAARAIQYGADALGLVGPMPSGPGVITDELIYAIASAIPPPVASFLLTSETRAEQIVLHHRRVKTSVIQLVDNLVDQDYHYLRQELPGIRLVQVIHVVDEASVEEAYVIAPLVDAILLDSGNPRLAVKELGGTGRKHDWRLSRKIRESIPVPLFLAGGIDAGNVEQALAEVQPFGLDLCSSVRTNGQLDEVKLKGFFQAVQRAII